MTYQLIVDDQNFELEASDVEHIDLLTLENNQYHYLEQGIGYQIQLIQKQGRSMSLLINGSQYDVKIEDSYDQLVKKMGLSISTENKISSILAPMPGLILEVLVAPGDTVEQGTALVILEAMKMENVLKAAGAAVVKSIEVNKGDTVEKSQILIEME